MSHPFGDLISQHLHRKHGLTQSKLAEGILKAPVIISDMCKGRRLTGPQARERVIWIIGWLHQQGALYKLDEANTLLDAAGMSPLNERGADEAVLIRALRPSDAVPPAPVPSRPSPNHNLPAQLTSFIGREDDIIHITAHLKTARLLTLTGAGGVGKTRLALEVAANLCESFMNGVWLVEFAPLNDSDLAPRVVASALKLSDPSGRSHLDALVDYFAGKHALLILDNCEHLIGAIAELAEQLLVRCPQLHLLTTSREALRVPGEKTYYVPSLKAPDAVAAGLIPLQTWTGTRLAPGPKTSADDVLRYDSVRLFVERAHASQTDFALTPDNIAGVVQVCKQLDGIPLALELAAALTQTMTAGEIAVQLNKRLSLLSSGYRTNAPRHQTMRHALDWSYDLLSPAEQRLLARLSVFAAGWMADVAEKVCADKELRIVPIPLPAKPSASRDRGKNAELRTSHDGRSDFLNSQFSILNSEVLPLLNQLVQKSLVVAEQQADQTRYRLLEPIRQYGAEKLDETGESDELRRRHINAFIELAKAAEPHLHGTEQKHWFDRLESEHDNLCAALAWSQSAAGDAALGLRLAASLYYFWWIRSHMREGRAWLDALLLATSPATPSSDRAWALLGAGLLAVHDEQGYADQQGIADLLEQSVALFRDIGDDAGLALALCEFAVATVNIRGEYERAASLVEDSVSASRRQDAQPWINAYVLYRLADLTYQQVDLARAMVFYQESLAVARRLGEATGVAAILTHLSDVTGAQLDFAQAAQYAAEAVEVSRAAGQTHIMIHALRQQADELRLMGDFERAAALVEDMYRISLDHDHREPAGSALTSFGLLARDQGDYARAAARFKDSIAWYRDKLGTWGNWHNILGLGTVASAQGQLQRAARLFGAADAWQKSFNFLRFPHNQMQFGTYMDATRAQLGEATYEAAFAEGCAMTTEQAFEYALADELTTPHAPESASLVQHDNPVVPPPSIHPAGLTGREIQVLRLLAHGLTYAEIADTLVISRRTVNGHATSIYSKLGVTSRAGAARFASDHHLA